MARVYLGYDDGCVPLLAKAAVTFRAALFLACAAILGGCAMPASGPSTRALSGADYRQIAIVNVSQRTLAVQRAGRAMSLAAEFGSAERSSALRLRRGDIISLSLWEAPPGNLFSSSIIAGQSVSNTSTITIPAQSVEADGTVTVPFAGRIAVEGDTPATVEAKIVKALQGKAVQPQVLVSVVKSSANMVTVTGEVAGGSRVPLTDGGERILDAIAAAGGLRAPVHESIVELTRSRVTGRIPFQTLLHNPKENLYLKPGDVVAVVREPQTFSVLGATGRNDEIVFDLPRVSMAQALGKAGGLQDIRADASGVFLFRVEPTAVAAQLLPPNSPYLDPQYHLVPMIYRFNLQDPQVMIATSQFWMQPGDVIYVSNATGAELQKFLSIIQGVIGPALNGAAVAVAVR
jgi:polysaccharide biosynthesis/export protein